MMVLPQFRAVAAGLLNQQLQYYQRAKNLFGANLIGHWQFRETSGTAAKEANGGTSGAYGGANQPALAAAQAPTGHPCPVYSAPGYITLPLSTIQGVEGGFSFFINPAAAAWTDAASHKVFSWLADANNVILVNLSNSSLAFSTKFGGVTKSVTPQLFTRSSWINVLVTWSKSKDRIDGYYNAGPILAGTGIGNWAGTVATTYFNYAAPYNLNGGYSDFIALNRYIEYSEVKQLCDWGSGIERLAILGDSISGGAASNNWTTQVAAGYTGSSLGLCHHGASGAKVMPNAGNDMDTQTTAAVNDDARKIIIELGTNDDDAGDMAALQAEYAENLAELKGSNPRATIYAVNVLPRWTDNTGATAVDKSHIRAAIAAACTAQGVTCWDTFTTPWITAGDTSDGLHPVASGHTKIANEILARL